MCCVSNIFINRTVIGMDCCPPIFSPCRMSAFSPGCFGYGFNPAQTMMLGAGIGLGAATVLAIPGIFKGLGSACSWLYGNVLKPVGRFMGVCAKGAWNGIKAAGRFLGTCGKGIWNGVKAAGSWIGNGIKNLWNKIF